MRLAVATFGNSSSRSETASQHLNIDDSPQTVPSKRIKQIVPGYDKPFMGNLAILQIGLETIRRECHHFDGWLSTLEQRARTTG